MEESECLATIPSYLLLGIDVGALLDAAVEQGGHVRHDADERVQLVTHYLHVPESYDPAYAETGIVEYGETASWQLDDAGADFQAAHRRQIAADGEVCDQEDGTLLCTKKEPSRTCVRAYVRVESVQNNRQATGPNIKHIQDDRRRGKGT